MNVSYSREQRREALKVYRRTRSVTKAILCELRIYGNNKITARKIS